MKSILVAHPQQLVRPPPMGQIPMDSNPTPLNRALQFHQMLKVMPLL